VGVATSVSVLIEFLQWERSVRFWTPKLEGGHFRGRGNSAATPLFQSFDKRLLELKADIISSASVRCLCPA